MKYALLFALSTFALSAFAQSENEMICRAQAKEVAKKIALEGYNNCMNEARLKELHEDYNRKRAEYKNKLDSMKAHLAELKTNYDTEVKKIYPSAGEEKAKPKSAQRTPRSSTKAPRSERSSGVVKTLPVKQNDSGPALPVQTVSESEKVITQAAATGEEDPEIIDIPIEN